MTGLENMVAKLTMDSQRRDAKERPVYLDEFRGKISRFLSHHDSSRQRQITVQPRVPDPATIGFYSNLEEACLAAFRDRSYLEVSFHQHEVIADWRAFGTRRLGLSTWVATMLTPAPCFHFGGRVNATRAA